MEAQVFERADSQRRRYDFMLFVILLASWVVCGVFAYGITLAYFQGEFPLSAREHYTKDINTAVFFGLSGIVGFAISFFLSGCAKHGLKFR